MDYSRLQYITDTRKYILEYMIFAKRFLMYNMELYNAGGAVWSARNKNYGAACAGCKRSVSAFACLTPQKLGPLATVVFGSLCFFCATSP